MPNIQSWYAMVLEVLEVGEEMCLGLIRASGGRGGVVELVEGTISSLDALAYARVLIELGRQLEAEEVVRAVIGAELDIPTPLGSQFGGNSPQGGQILA